MNFQHLPVKFCSLPKLDRDTSVYLGRFFRTSICIFLLFFELCANGADNSLTVKTGLKLWLAGDSIVQTDAAQVSQRNGYSFVRNWVDSSGGNQNASQLTDDKQPAYLPTGLSGKPAVRFDGINDLLSTTLPQIFGDKSIFIVQKRVDYTNPSGAEISSTTSGQGMFFGNNQTAETVGRLGVAHDLTVAGVGRNICMIKAFVRSGSSGTLWINDSTYSASLPDSASGNYALSDGAYFPFSGIIAEVLIYDRSVTESERQSISIYLAQKYSLGVYDHSSNAGPRLSISSGLRLWFSADSISTADPNQTALRNGSYFLKNWLDLSSSGRNANQANESKQPIVVSNAINGKAVARFDGVDDSMTTTLPQIAGDKSIFMVHRRSALSASSGVELSSSTASQGMFLAQGAGAETLGRLGVAHDLRCAGVLNDFVLKSYIRSGPSSTLAVNDSSATGSPPDAASGNYSLSDGSSFAFAGDIAELLIYNRAVTSSERQSIENYFAEKYGLWTLSVPVQSGLQLALSADAIDPLSPSLTRVVNGITYVYDWMDRSVNGNHATQYSSSNWRPQYLPNILNGRPILRFDGVDDFLTTTLPQIAGDKALFIVYKRNGAGTEVASSTQTAGHFLGNSGSAETKGRHYVATDLQVAAGYGSEYMVKRYLRSGSNETLWVNDLTSSASVPDAASGYYSISGGSQAKPTNNALKGDVAELLIFNRSLSETERHSIEDYLQYKWSYKLNNLFSVAADLQPPAISPASPAAGLRVKQTTPEYAGTNVYHTLFLPRDWQSSLRFPVIVEYTGNGPYSDNYGDVCTGNVEDAALGYGLSGGQGFIWICMPTIGGSPLTNQQTDFGDVNATKDYCMKTVRYVCENFGGDPGAVILAGFSRGSIACNYIGLNDDAIADVWLAFIPHSHYDGFEWQYDTPAWAASRLNRLKGRAQHISHEIPTPSPEDFLRQSGIDVSQLSFRTLPFLNHTDRWALRSLQVRKDTRAWLQQVLSQHPGTYSIRGRVTSFSGNALPGVRVESGFTHFAYTDLNGIYNLSGLINSTRTVTVSGTTPQTVTVSGTDVSNVNFIQ